MDAVNGNIEDAITAFESIKNVVSYWNLALVSDVGIEFRFVCSFVCFENLIVSCVDFSQESWRHWKWCPVSWRTRRMQKLSKKDKGLPDKDFRWQWFKYFCGSESKLLVFFCNLVLLITAQVLYFGNS